MKRLLSEMIECVNREEKILLKGVSGSGKSTAVCYLAFKTNNPLRRVCMNKFFEIEDFQKRLKIKNNCFEAQNSDIVDAMVKG